MDASERGRLLDKLADLVERDRAILAVSGLRKRCTFIPSSLFCWDLGALSFCKYATKQNWGKANARMSLMKSGRYEGLRAEQVGNWGSAECLFSLCHEEKTGLPCLVGILLPPPSTCLAKQNHQARGDALSWLQKTNAEGSAGDQAGRTSLCPSDGHSGMWPSHTSYSVSPLFF